MKNELQIWKGVFKRSRRKLVIFTALILISVGIHMFFSDLKEGRKTPIDIKYNAVIDSLK